MTEHIVPPAKIRNTSDPREAELDGLLMLANAMSGGEAEDMIYAQEKAGQRQLVNSDRLPTDAYPDDGPYKALGFTFGPPDPSDPMFRPATLPEGWKRQATDHDMWSKIADQYGRERVAVFYKAAFYDRRAFMRLETPESYLRSCLLWNKTEPVLDDKWLTVEVAVEALDDMHSYELKQANKAEEYRTEGRGDPDYWTGRIAEHRAEAAEIKAMADRVRAGAK